MSRARYVLEILASVAVLFVSGLMVSDYLSKPSSPVPRRAIPPLPVEPVPIGEWAKGNVNAPVVLLEFTDFQCPFCRRFAQDTLPAIDQRYLAAGKVQLRFGHLPLDGIHPLAR